MSAYAVVLYLHSWLRWGVVALAIATCARAAIRSRRGAPFGSGDRRLAVAFTATLDVQLSIGLSLYFVWSPVTPRSFGAFGAAMASSPTRFFAIEHANAMVLAALAAHVGSAASRRARDDRGRHRRLAIGAGLALLAILVGMPWPFMPYGRPLLRLP